MNYTEFISAVKAEVKALVGPDIIVELHTAVKNNGTVRKGLMIARRGVNISPAIYLEEFYQQYQTGRTIRSLAFTILQIYEKVKVQNSYPCENIRSYEKVKDKIVYKLIQRDCNEELLSEVPNRPLLDLAQVYYVLLESAEFGSATLLIRKEHLKEWKVNAEEVAEMAEANTPRLLPLKLESLTDYMLVMTNQTQNQGACAVCYPGALEKAWDRLGEDYYAIPSSIHEMILIPESYGLSRAQLECMMEDINVEEVEKEEVLGKRVYYYSRKEGRLQ